MKWLKKEPRRLTLRGWAALDDLRREIEEEGSEGRWENIPPLIFKVIQLSFKPNKNIFWLDTVELFRKTVDLNAPIKDFPILRARDKSDPEPWEYVGRSWYFWVNLLASNYGWSEEQIGALDIDTAIGLYQEIQVNNQLKDEFQWGLSETSYSYDKTTKKSRLTRMPRPRWMTRAVEKKKTVKKTKIPSVSMPIGVIEKLTPDED